MASQRRNQRTKDKADVTETGLVTLMTKAPTGFLTISKSLDEKVQWGFLITSSMSFLVKLLNNRAKVTKKSRIQSEFKTL